MTTGIRRKNGTLFAAAVVASFLLSSSVTTAIASAAEVSDVAVLRQVEPKYPTKALLECIGGEVHLGFIVMPDGKAKDINVIKSTGDGMFDAAAIEAVRQWDFKPRTVNGKAVPRKAVLPFEFREPGGCIYGTGVVELLVPGIALLLAIEFLVALSWSEGLWSLGVPLFRTSRRLNSHSNPLDDGVLNSMSTDGLGAGPRFVFRRFSDGSIAFRESFRPRIFGFHYTPLMRGRISFNPYMPEIELVGIAYTPTLGFLAMFLFVFFAAFTNGEAVIPTIFLVFVTVMFGFLWFIQARRFGRIADCVKTLAESGESSGMTSTH